MKDSKLDVPVTTPLDADTVAKLQTMADNVTDGNRAMLIRRILRKAISEYEDTHCAGVTDGQVM